MMQQSKDNDETEYKPQPSTRISTSNISSDNDTWTEYLTIVELPRRDKRNTFELQIRSFFESKATGEKVWGEPPTGATHVLWATEDMKKMAHEQMCDLMVVEKAAEEEDEEEENPKDGCFLSKKQGDNKGTMQGTKHNVATTTATCRGTNTNMDLTVQADINNETVLSGVICQENERKGKNRRLVSSILMSRTKKKQQAQIQQGVNCPILSHRKLVYRKGSKTDSFSKGIDTSRNSSNNLEENEDRQQQQQQQKGQNILNLEDFHLQLAMAMSLEQKEERKSKLAVTCGDGDNDASNDEIQDIEMAKALSLSEVVQNVGD